jgi:hypothetical protein
VKIPDSAKYDVRDSTGTPITRGTRRKDAHAVRSLLGDDYYVYNRFTNRRSYEQIDARDECTCVEGSERYYPGTDGARHNERCSRVIGNRTDLEWN